MLGLRGRVVAAYASVALVLSLAAGAMTWIVSSRQMIDTRGAGLVREAQTGAELISRVLSPSPPDLPREAQDLAAINGSRLLVTQDGRELASVGLTIGQVPARVRQLVQSGVAARQRVRVEGQPYWLVALPLEGARGGYYELFPLQDVDRTLRLLSWTLVTSGLSVVALSGLLGWTAARRALHPVTELSAAAEAAARGDLSARMVTRDPDLAPIAASFNSTLAALQRRVEAGTHFAGNVSHELRTPLTALVNASAVLDRRRDQLPPVAREAVEVLSTQITRFQRLVLDLLEILVVTEGPSPSLQPVRLDDLLALLAATEGWPLEIDEPLEVRADPRRLERMVRNLATNAQEHGGGLVRLAARRSGDRARIEVDDAGPGVAPEARQSVFDRFSRLGRRGGGPRSAGLGLGLALVAELTALHGGQVWVEERPGGGARFVLELPLHLA